MAREVPREVPQRGEVPLRVPQHLIAPAMFLLLLLAGGAEAGPQYEGEEGGGVGVSWHVWDCCV